MRPRSLLSLALLPVALIGMTLANVYDVVMPLNKPSCECLPWASAATPGNNLTQADIDNMFVGGAAAAAAAGSSCAMPGAQSGTHMKDCALSCFAEIWEFEYITSSYAGPWCFCKDPVANVTNTSQYCTPPIGVPEQVNLQYAAPGVVVVAFVTYEDNAAAAAAEEPPQALLTPKGGAAKTLSGVSHLYVPPGRNSTYTAKPANPTDVDMPYHMHYVKLTVVPGQSYTYKVKGGGAVAAWSAEFEFRAPANTQGAGAVTKIATYGDMGHSHYNNMQNLKDDAAKGLIDVVVHMGDHAYDIGSANDRRGDAYLNAYQPALSTLPWFPIIGNHEWVYHPKPGGEFNGDGDHGLHYEVIAWGEAYGTGADQFPVKAPYPAASRDGGTLRSTATSALGHHLAAGSFYGMGLHGTTPSNTSRYTSADIGLVHMIALDLNLLDPTQLAWLTADLKQANANRKNVPWIMAMSHFPLFHSQTQANENMSASHYRGDEILGDYEKGEVGTSMKFEACEAASGPGSKKPAAGCQTVGQFQLSRIMNLQPLFAKYGVDVYNAGHVHSYENTWPLCNLATGEVCKAANGSSIQSFAEPKGTVHITEGNGGVPGVPGTFSAGNCGKDTNSTCRKTGTGGAYGRITATPNTLTYDRVANNGGSVTDTWTITQHNHGPFPSMMM